VGAELLCDVTWKRATVRGKALLETSELLFRSSDLRLKFAFKDMRSIEVKGDALRITTAEGVASFALGPRAAAWAEKIRNPKSLIDKLGVKAEHRVVFLGVRDEDFLSQLRARATDVSTRLRKHADAIFLQTETTAGLARLMQLRDAIKPDGMIWTVTPKGKGGMREGDVMAAGKAAGLVDVKVAAFSATHSAAKFVIPKSQR
jgi:hypothetical protein